MPDDPKPDEKKPDDEQTPDPDAGAKKALAEERKARRDADAKVKELSDSLAAIQDKDKSEVERLTGKLSQLEKDLATATQRADRYEVALDKGLDMTRAKRLTGATRDELEADADELKGWTAGKEGGGAIPDKPKENLSGGGDPTDEPEETDPRKLAAQIPRY